MKTIGKYQVLEEIGRSAAGATYRARDAFRNREYALKLLTPLAALSASSKEQLYRDLAASWELPSRHMAVIRDVGELEGSVYIASEFLNGAPLSRPEALANLSVAEKLTLAEQILEALASAHAYGFAHGNLKPSNIFVTRTNNAAVLDFGTGTWHMLLLGAGVRLNGLLPNYLAPEQILGERFDSRSDVFSAGVILYQMLTGQYPFQAESGVIPREIVHAAPEPLRKWNEQISEELERVIGKALNKDPKDRFETAAEFGAELHAIGRNLGAEAPAPTGQATESSASQNPPRQLAAPAVSNPEAALVVASPAPPPVPMERPAPVPAEVASLAASVTVIPPVQARPLPPPAPVRALPKPARPQPAAPARRANGQRSLITFGVGAVMALSMVGVILVRQNVAAPGVARQQPAPAAAQQPVPQATETVKPAPVPTAPAGAAATQPPAQPAPADALAEQIIRTQVRPLWESGQYIAALRLVDEILVADPANSDARAWKKKIRAAEEAEAGLK